MEDIHLAPGRKIGPRVREYSHAVPLGYFRSLRVSRSDFDAKRSFGSAVLFLRENEFQTLTE